MSNENLELLPIWKKNSSAEDRFLELAVLARKYPQQFNRFIILYQTIREDGAYQIRQVSANCDTIEALGLVELGRIQLLKDAKVI